MNDTSSRCIIVRDARGQLFLLPWEYRNLGDKLLASGSREAMQAAKRLLESP